MYYRRDINILDGGPDDPTRVWEEFARIRKHLMRLDQNNIRTVRSDRIVPADDPGHQGISDIRTADTDKMSNLGFFPYIESYDEKSFNFEGDQRKWSKYRDGFYLDLFSKWESDWIVASGCEVLIQAPTQGHAVVEAEWAIHSSVSQGSVANAVAALGSNHTTNTAIPYENSNSVSCVTTLRVPAGPFRVYPMIRPTWKRQNASSGDPTDQTLIVKKANMYAFALYR